jgi:hypothetical protein
MTSGRGFNVTSFRTSWTSPGVNGDVAFSALKASYERAVDAKPGEVSTAHVVLADAVVRLNVVGHRLASSISRAFRHLTTANGVDTSQFTIDLWDQRATGVDCPHVARTIEQRVRTERKGNLSVAVGTAGDRYVGHLRPGIHVWMDRKAAHAIGWVASGERLSGQDRAKPLHFPLLLWHADRGIPVVHAALVSWHDHGALLVGREGAGKTIAALACFLGGLDFLGDDYIALQRIGSDRFVGHSLYDSVRLTFDAETRFPELIQHTRPRQRFETKGKRLVRAVDVAPLRVRRSAEICDVVAISRSDDSSASVGPLSRAEALLSIAPSSMLQLPVSGTAHMERMAELIGHVPTHRLTVGRDLATLPILMKALLERRIG